MTVILVSEIGDKTFFIAAILAMRNNKLIIFLSALAALYLMTILSALLGWVVTTFIPREITYYTCTAIMFLFSLKMLWEAWRMKEDEVQEVQREVELELADMDGDKDRKVGGVEGGENNRGFSRGGTRGPGPAILQLNNEDHENKNRQEDGLQGNEIKGHVINFLTKYVIAKPPSQPADKTDSPGVLASNSPPPSQPHNDKENVSWMDNVIDRGCRENSWFGKKCLKIFKVINH